MLCGIVVKEELIAVFAHLTDVGSEHAVDSLDKRLYRIARAIEAIAILLCQRARIAVRVSAGNDRLAAHQVRQQTARVVRDSETIVEEDQAHITRISQTVIILLGQSAEDRHSFRTALIHESLQLRIFRTVTHNHEMAILTVLNRPHALHQKRNPLRLSHIATIYKYRLIRWQPIFLPYPLRLIANANANAISIALRLFISRRHIIRIRRNLHLLRLHLWVMLQHKAHVRGTHAADKVRDAIQLLLLLAEHLVEHSLHARFRHHPQIDSILRKDILQQQVGHSLRVPPLSRLDHLVERDGRRAVEDKVKPHIAEIPVHGAHKQVLQ